MTTDMTDDTPRMEVVHAYDGDRCPSCTDTARRVARLVWTAAHEFDADALRTGRCAIGSYPTCAHRLTLKSSLYAVLTSYPEARTWEPLR